MVILAPIFAHMATVYRHGKQWVAQWYRADGSRVKRGTRESKRREAERVAAAMEAEDRKQKDPHGMAYVAILDRATAEAKAGKLSLARATEYLTELRQVSDPSFKVVSLKAFLVGWLADSKMRVSERSAIIYAQAVGHFETALGSVAMDAPLGDLTRRQIERGMMAMQKGGRKGAGINLDLTVLRQALRQAALEKLIPANPADGIPLLSQEDSTERAPFTADEVRRIIEHPETPEEWRGAVLCGAHTALRLGDVVRLGREHVNDAELVIRPTKTKRTGKTMRIPLTPALLAWIGDKQGPFFPDLSGCSITKLSKQFCALMKRAGVPATVTLPGGITASRSFHSLRHSFASWLADANIHADVRQKLTGHSSSSIHARYTHHDDALRRAVSALPDLEIEQRKPAGD